ncbi:ABC-2 family transporter protein [Myxococcota bacterium]|nr:ABC-2 family transporter protein [Myxococcota bacterium]
MSARLLRTLGASWRVSLLTATQYRGDFLLTTLMSVGWAAWTLLPLYFVYRQTPVVAGWSPWEALLVMAFFLLLRGVLDAFIEPNLRGLVEKVRDGTLDFVLLKPADAQVLVSFARLDPGRLVDILGATGLAGYALHRLGHVPSAGELGLALVATLSGLAMLYALWLCAAATTFFWVKIESLSYLLGALLDAGRWPAAVYRGWLRLVLTFVLPVTLMTTVPAEALLARAGWRPVAISAGLAVVFLWGSRRLWRFAVSRYTSASS